MNFVLKWLDLRLPILASWRKHATEYYVPKNLNFFYYFGFLMLLVLFNQMITGLWLAMFYTPSADRAFDSVQLIMHDVNFGWLLRYMHTTGASFIFILGYLHLFRSILYGSYQKPRELVWLFGVVLFLLLLAEAFCGYLLPWGQMSYWGAQVITSLFGVIPFFGDGLMTWIRGDFLVGDATLHRFYALHVIGIPLILIFVVAFHIFSLRQVGSNNPEGIEIRDHLDHAGKPLDGIPFYPDYMAKEVFGLVVFLLLFAAVLFFAPTMWGYFIEAANVVPANPMVTPDDIRPIWYMAPFYAMLRAIPDKTLGVVVMNVAVLVLLVLPWLDASPVRSMRYKGIWSKLALMGFVISFLLLGYLGGLAVTKLRIWLARVCIVIYWGYFFLMPYITRYETCCAVPERITN